MVRRVRTRLALAIHGVFCLAPQAFCDTLPDPLAAGWQGQPVCERLSESDSSRVLRCSFPPGVGHETHYHRPNFGYVLSGGRMRLEDDEGVREVELTTGTYYHSEGTEWHRALNVGETTVVYLVVENW